MSQNTIIPEVVFEGDNDVVVIVVSIVVVDSIWLIVVVVLIFCIEDSVCFVVDIVVITVADVEVIVEVVGVTSVMVSDKNKWLYIINEFERKIAKISREIKHKIEKLCSKQLKW